jgi:hypothetical protein
MKRNLRVDIYFALTKKQRQKLHAMGYSHTIIEFIPMNKFVKITKKKVIIDKLIELKRNCIRRVA